MRIWRIVIVGVLTALLVAAAGVGGWLLHGSDDRPAAATTDAVKVGVPTIVTPEQLAKVAADHSPIYWAGERRGTQIELTLTTKNSIFVRYLPDGEKAGSTKKYLTVGTYGAIDGYNALSAAKKNVADVAHGQNGAVITVFKKRPQSTYFSFKNAGFEVEVFSPAANQARQLTDDGSVKLVGGTR